MSPPLPGPAPASVGSSVVVAIVRVMFSDDGLGDDSGGVGVASSSSSSIGTLASAGLSAAPPPLVLGMSVLRCAGVTLKVHSLEKVCELTVGSSESHFISRSAMVEGCSLDSSMIS